MESLTGSLQQATLSEVLPQSHSIPSSLTKSYKVLNVETDCWVQLYGDCVLIGISQVGGKVGTFLKCDVEETVMDPKPRFTVTTLLGKHGDNVLEVYARRITERIAQLRSDRSHPCPSVLLAISLSKKQPKQQGPEMFRLLVDLLVDLYKEAILQVQA